MTEKPRATEGTGADRSPGRDDESSYLSTPAGVPLSPVRSRFATGREGLMAPPASDATGLAVFAGGLNILLGVWLVLAPTVLNYDNTGRGFDAYWNDRVIGVTVALLAILRVAMPDRFSPLSWLNMVLGGWLIAAPFVLDYNAGIDAPRAMGNDIVIGAFVLLLAMASAVAGLVASRERTDEATGTT